MRKLLTLLFLFVSMVVFSQNNGINFQGIGRNSSGAVLASTKLTLRFTVLQVSETGTIEYIESKEVLTNAQGIFSTVIGDGTQISKTGNFSDINWKINPKFLKVEMDPAGGTSFIAMGTTRLQSVPFAYYANGVNADNVDGVLSASKGGTGVASISALKTALGIDQINNTSDLAKPISTETRAILDTKVSSATFSNTIALFENSSNKASAIDLGGNNPSDILYPTQKAVKEYIAANSASGVVADGGISNIKLSDGAVSYEKFQRIPSNSILGNTTSSTTVVQAIETTGSVKVVLSNNPTINSPTLINPTIGDATANTITFANGSKIGDIQNISEGSPDGNGSIDLFAPLGANWTQLNYGNQNYFSLDANGAYLEIDGLNWNYLGNGDSELPGDLKLKDDKSIHFISADESIQKPNASITANGPFLKIQTRALTPNDDTDAENGISLEYENLNNLKINNSGVQLLTWNTINRTPSFVDVRESSFNFFSNDNSNNQNRWYFNGTDASSHLPGALDLAGNIVTLGNLKLGNTVYPNLSGNSGDVLTIDGVTGNAIWQAPTIGTGNFVLNGVASSTQSFTTSNVGNDFSIESDAITGMHTFILPDASGTSRGLLTSADYATFSAKQDALTNPITGTGASGQLSFFNGTTSLSSSSNLLWDATHQRLGIGTSMPGYPLEINTGSANYGLMISSESLNSWGSGIGFKSSTDAVEKTGLFQLDRDGAMVFRTFQDNMYFDNAGSGSIKFRMGDPNASNIGMSLNNSGNLEVTGTLKTGAVLYPNVSGTIGDVLTADASGNPIWQAPAVNIASSNINAGTLSGTTLNSTITNSSLTSVGTLANLTVSNPINGSITGNASTVTTNANLTGVVTSIGNVTSIASGAISNSMLANTAVTNLSGVNTGDNAVNTRYDGLEAVITNLDNTLNARINSKVSNAAHYGDIKALMTGSDGYYVIGINGTRLMDLQTGILKNTNGTGVPSIAVASDFPTLNQSTTGNAATATKFSTSKNINGVAFDGTSDITIAADAGTLSGNTLKSSVINSSLTSVGTLANLTVTNPINGSINGNAASALTATKLTNPRNINGTAFDGTSDIIITSDAGSLTGTTLKSSVINSSLTSVGTLANLTVTNTINGSINGNAASASTATKLTNARNINGVAFDGTSNITVVASAGTLTGTTLNASVTGSSLTSVGVLNNATVNGKVIVGASSETSASAVLEASSTTQGFLPPRMTIAQRLAIVNPSQGLMIYCTNCGTYGEPQYYNGNSWMNFAGTATSKGTPTITISVGTYIYTGAAQGPTSATNTGTGSTYSFTYVGTGSTTYASSSTKPTNAGTYNVTVSLSASGDGNYNAASASAAFTIAQAIPTVTPTVGTYAYSGSSQGPSAATNTGTGTSYTFSYTGTGITSYGPSATKPTDGGTYTVIATVAANGNYATSSSSATAFRISLNLAVGNTYGGGKVAYILKAGDIGYDANQQHGIIVSGYLSTNMVVWGNKLEITGASGGAAIYNNDFGTWDYPPADLETGMINTNLIISSEGSGTNYPASIARAYSGGGYTNWYLPSASQMNAMKANLSPSGVNYVWTSTEDGAYDAFTWNIINGGYQTQPKDNPIAKFLAARSF